MLCKPVSKSALSLFSSLLEYYFCPLSKFDFCLNSFQVTVILESISEFTAPGSQLVETIDLEAEDDEIEAAISSQAEKKRAPSSAKIAEGTPSIAISEDGSKTKGIFRVVRDSLLIVWFTHNVHNKPTWVGPTRWVCIVCCLT